MNTVARTLESLINCTAAAEVFDCTDVAEFRIKLIPFKFPVNFIAFTNVEVPEGQTAQDVYQSYKEKGHFDFEKFVKDHGPLKFVAREKFDTDDLDKLIYQYEHLHLGNQEDFCSPFTESENKLIQSKLLETYQRILFLGEMGFNAALIGDFLNESNDMSEEIDSSLILFPLLTAKQLNEKITADNFTVKLGKSPSEIFVQFTLKSHDAETYMYYSDHFSVDAGVWFNVDHSNSKLSVKEVNYAHIQIEEFSSDQECHLQINFDEWFSDLIEKNNLMPIAQSLCSKATLERKLIEIVTSDLTTSTIASHIFIAD